MDKTGKIMAHTSFVVKGKRLATSSELFPDCLNVHASLCPTVFPLFLSGFLFLGFIEYKLGPT